MKNKFIQSKGFTLLEILVVMAIISVLLAVGASAISQFGKRQNVVSQGYLLKNKLKSFQNSAINQRLEGESERYQCGEFGGFDLCNDNRWFYGVGVKIDYTNNKIVAQRIFKNATGHRDVAKLQWKEPAKFPTQSFTTAYLIGNTSNSDEFVIDTLSPISETELLDEVKLRQGQDVWYTRPNDIQINQVNRCDYIVFLSVTGKPIAFNGEGHSTDSTNIATTIDKCIILMSHEDDDQMVRGLIFRKGQTTIEQCLSPEDCGNKFGVFNQN
jgi:prepilin-type N-terminal cleavage/methylation domain-containing protein